MSKGCCICILACLTFVATNAQTRKYLLEGNNLYQQKKYKEAAVDYQKVLKQNPTYTPGLFNLGNSLYQQKQFDAARQVMATTAKAAPDKGGKAQANYNIGNTYMAEQKWDDAIDAYKQTLRNNPQDADAKYNLSYAAEMLKKQQDKNNKQNKDNKDNKQNKDQQKNKQNQQNKDQQNKDQQNKDQQNKDQQPDKPDQKQDQQHPQSQPSKLSKQQADQLLNALQQEEKKLHDKMKKENGVPVKTEKDW